MESRGGVSDAIWREIVHTSFHEISVITCASKLIQMVHFDTLNNPHAYAKHV